MPSDKPFVYVRKNWFDLVHEPGAPWSYMPARLKPSELFCKPLYEESPSYRAGMLRAAQICRQRPGWAGHSLAEQIEAEARGSVDMEEVDSGSD